jgi:hypothetical protein
MPVRLEWHTSLPVLQATYNGILSAKEYYAMCRQRSDMLDRGPEQIVLVVDAQRIENFPDAATVERGENVLWHPKVYRTLIALPEDLYLRLARAVIADNELPVHFYPGIDRALDAAETLTARLP